METDAEKDETHGAKNKGQLIVDATCTPADIRYPNDMSLLNESRENAERIIDFLHGLNPRSDGKPRDYRVNAHRDFIEYTKKRRPTVRFRRKSIRKQLNYLKRDMRYIGDYLSVIDKRQIPYRFLKRLEVIRELYEQQTKMYQRNERRVDHRIVSVSQPHVRPIVRGKAGTPVEFGAKISLSLSEGFCYIDHLSWENFNEAKDLKFQIEHYRTRNGYYPESVHADKIYQNRENRKYCKERGIRMSGKPLGRPVKITEKNKEKLKEEKKQRYQDDVDRIAIEGRFGVGKRKYGLGLIKSKLRETSESDIYISIMVMNLDKMGNEEMSEIKNRFKVAREKAS